ncbi:hypothetical protein YC2023_075692 [Brassica napus]|uniref:Aminotransferase-like plant mobile domain-containing protein n=2 Tax=Brassica oleracea TaxID=3712 RepID=A0A0D3CQ08_BRAOL|nr:PREDICTED: uncharacterized protein LOC106300561 [Brassica oleracea var. oleracea]VDD60327.1 unnamed protein product [Brassica oleracea]
MDDSESSPLDLKALSLTVSFPGWRKANSAFKSWATKMSLLHKPTWQKAGIFEAIMASTKGFNKDTDLVLGIAERWCPDTNSFLFPWGEATVTLEDVMVLLGFSVLGSPVFAAVDGSGEKSVRKLEKEWLKIKKDNKVSFVTQVTWMGRFMDSGDELENAAFLGLWLSYFVFPTRYSHVDKAVLPIALHLSRGTRIALAPAVLAHLYADLTLLEDHIRCFNMTTGVNNKVELSSLFKLVQVWTWERFRELRPNNTNQLLRGDPRLALWDEAKQKTMRSNVRKMTKSNVREILANSKMESFEWRPYTKAVKNWKIPQFYPEKAMWVPVGPYLDEELISFARCIKASELVGVDSTVEHYFPNRVASQFGLLQDVPCPVVNRNNLSKEAAWEEYNKSIYGLTLYIPSRSAESCFTPVFCEWWRKGSPVIESSTPRNIIRGDDDDDTSEPVPSGSKKRKSVRRVCKKDVTHMDLYQTQVPSEKEEEDDRLTIGQVMRSRKKNTAAMCSSDENPPTVLPLKEVVKKMGKEFPEKFKRSRYLRTPKHVRSEVVESGRSASREVPTNELFNKEVVPFSEVVQKKRKEFLEKLRSRYLRTPTDVRSEIADSGGSASREVPLNELFQKEEVVKRKREHLGDKRAREDGVRVASEAPGKRNHRREGEADNKGSWIRQKIAYEDETVATLKIKQRSEEEEEETGNKAGKNMVLSSAKGNNSSDLPLGANGGVVDIAVSRPKTRQKCDDDVNELFQKEEVMKRKRGHLGYKRAREDDGESCMDCYDNIITAEMVINREKSVGVASESLGKRNSRRLERDDNNDSWIRQKIATKDETVAQREETGNKAGKSKVLSSANGNNSSDPPLSANEVVDIVVSRPKTRNCDDEVDVNGIKAEKEKMLVSGGTKEPKCVIHEDGENQRSNEKEDDGKSLKQTNLAIDEISLSLEARMMNVEKTLAKIREWKTIERNQLKNGISA